MLAGANLSVCPHPNKLRQRNYGTAQRHSTRTNQNLFFKKVFVHLFQKVAPIQGAQPWSLSAESETPPGEKHSTNKKDRKERNLLTKCGRYCIIKGKMPRTTKGKGVRAWYFRH